MGSRESDHQAAWFDWAKLTPAPGFPGKMLADFAFAVPNGAVLAGAAAQRARYMNFLKRTGLKRGVSDVMLALPRGGYHGLFMEFKRDDASTVTQEQREWVDLMLAAGYHAGIVRGVAKAISFTAEYLKS